MIKYPDGVYRIRHNYLGGVIDVEIVDGKLLLISPEQGRHWFHPEFFFAVNHIVKSEYSEILHDNQ